MLGSGLKKLAKELGLKVDQGVGFGEYLGYNITLSEGIGTKVLGISTKAPADDQVEAFLNSLPDPELLLKDFRVTNLEVRPDAFVIFFHDNPGTMGKYRDFLNWILPQLSNFKFTGKGICPLCGVPVSSFDPWKLDEVVVHHIHTDCSLSIEADSADLADQIRAQDTGSYGMGFVGALLGALLGAIPWAVALYFGFFVSMLGFVIGFLAQKGYDLFHGRIGKGKIAIVIVTSIIGVVFGNVLSDVIIVGSLINSGEIYGAVMSDIPEIIALGYTDMEYMKEFLANLAMGLIFALLGMYGMIRDLLKNDPTSQRKMKDIQLT